MLRNVIKRSKTINKLNNTKIKKNIKQNKRNYRKKIYKIRSLGFKTDSILKEIIEDVIEDVYEEFGKTGERIAFKILHHIAEFDNHKERRREQETIEDNIFSETIEIKKSNFSHHFSYVYSMLKEVPPSHI